MVAVAAAAAAHARAARAPDAVHATQTVRSAVRGASTPPVPVSRIVTVRFSAAVRHGPGALVLVRAPVAHAEPAEQHEQVAAVLLREQCVQVRVGARVERIEEHQQDLGVGHVDQRVTGQRGQAEERDRGPAREIREHQ